jgi:hypothetical protein
LVATMPFFVPFGNGNFKDERGARVGNWHIRSCSFLKHGTNSTISGSSSSAFARTSTQADRSVTLLSYLSGPLLS